MQIESYYIYYGRLFNIVNKPSCQRLSLNRSQYDCCSTKYNTLAGSWVVYGSFYTQADQRRFILSIPLERNILRAGRNSSLLHMPSNKRMLSLH